MEDVQEHNEWSMANDKKRKSKNHKSADDSDGKERPSQRQRTNISSTSVNFGNRPTMIVKDKNRPSIDKSNSMNKSAFVIISDKGNVSDGPRPNFIPDYALTVTMTSLDEGKPITKVNPFVIKKLIDGVCGTVKKVQYCRTGNLLIETFNNKQVRELLKVKSCMNGQYNVKVELATRFDTVKGVIYAPELFDCSEEVILKELEVFGVLEVKRINKGKEKEKTPLLVLSFAGKNLPEYILAGYRKYDVRCYMPKPLRCFVCQKFGHSSKSGCKLFRCVKCGLDHDSQACACLGPYKCVNCKGEHMASSFQCPNYKKEVEIIAIKVKQNISFPEARKIYYASQPRMLNTNSHRMHASYSNAVNNSVPGRLNISENRAQATNDRSGFRNSDARQGTQQNGAEGCENIISNDIIVQKLNELTKLLSLIGLARPSSGQQNMNLEKNPNIRPNLTASMQKSNEYPVTFDNESFWAFIAKLQSIMSTNLPPEKLTDKIANYANTLQVASDKISGSQGFKLLYTDNEY
ncbi:unnamed protein product [Rotaria socialis]|nr:unnamed protein product [Rotaria socialis]